MSNLAAGSSGSGWRLRSSACLLFLCVLFTSGCERMRPRPSSQYVFVTAKQGLLRDRIAAVSNRTGTVANGDKLEVLERGRRFIKVKTAKGEIGWLDEKSVATQETFDAFDKLAKDHMGDPAVASGVVRDEVYMHLKPGRETERFYRLAEGDKLKLIARATLPKALPPGVLATRAATPAASAASTASTAKPAGKASPAALPPPVLLPVMEDWWLVRDGQNRTGWVYSRMMDVDAPDSLTRYAEGQRFVGAYVLTTVNDPEAPQEDKNIPVFLTVLSPYKAGLSYDFDQVRLFTWNVKKHRYETGFREKNVEGYLPVSIGKMKDLYGKGIVAQTELPSFTYKVLSADSPAPAPDPVTGIVSPGKLVTKTYRLEGNTVHRILAPGEAAPDEAHPEPPPEKKTKGKKKR